LLYLEKYDDRIPGEKFSGCAIGMERDISEYHPKIESVDPFFQNWVFSLAKIHNRRFF